MSHVFPASLQAPRSRLSSNGPELSRIVAGMWRIGEWNMSAAAPGLIEQCLALGVTSFDHADIYGDYSAEGLFGEALALQPGLRDKMELVSKCGIKLLAAPPGPHHPALRHERSAHHQFRGTQLAPAADGPPGLAADPPSRPADGFRRDRRRVYPVTSVGQGALASRTSAATSSNA
jgi:hypothetical protein